MGFLDFFKPSNDSQKESPDKINDLHEEVDQNKPFPNAGESEWGKPKWNDLVNDKGELKDDIFAGGYTKIPGGGAIIYDADVNFYQVVKGDTIKKIAQKLANFHPDFEYLINPQTSDNQNTSFNIPSYALRVGDWIPVPLETKKLNEEQFANYCFEAIKLMQINPEYGTEITELLAQIGETELIATMIAIAKQESGGRPIGQFVFHRWEPERNAFSFSIMHVLDKGAGLKARKKLQLSKGQLYHPQNAAKLFLAFLIEKVRPRREKAEKYLPLSKNLEAFTAFYNGTEWKKYNPNYAKKLQRYYKKAKALLNGETLEPERFFYTVGSKTLERAIEESNTLNTREYPNEHLNSMLVIDANVSMAVRTLQKRVQSYYKTDVKPTDEIAIWINKEGRTYMTHRRNGNDIDIRIKPDIYPLGKS